MTSAAATPNPAVAAAPVLGAGGPTR